jgi:hypothetical protein
MPITRRPSSSSNGSLSPKDVNALIGRGGRPARETPGGKNADHGEYVAVMLRIRERDLAEVDRLVDRRPVKISRNYWLLEAIHEKALREAKQ